MPILKCPTDEFTHHDCTNGDVSVDISGRSQWPALILQGRPSHDAGTRKDGIDTRERAITAQYAFQEEKQLSRLHTVKLRQNLLP